MDYNKPLDTGKVEKKFINFKKTLISLVFTGAIFMGLSCTANKVNQEREFFIKETPIKTENTKVPEYIRNYFDINEEVAQNIGKELEKGGQRALLPWRPVSPDNKYSGLIKQKPKVPIFIPCGAEALKDAFSQLGVNVPLEDLIRERKSGFLKGFLSVFSENAKNITWPYEMENIAEKYGFEVERITGEKVNLATIIEKSNEDSVVIARVTRKGENELIHQHYAVYDTNIAKLSKIGVEYFGKYIDEYSKIHELYLIKKKMK